MNKTIKKIIIITAAILAVVAIAAGVIFILKANNISNDRFNSAVTNESADALKFQAVEALNTDKDKARSLFEEAKAQYEKLEDQDDVVDMEAQIYLLDHPVQSK